MSRFALPLGSLVAWSAVALVVLVVGWSLPIDDFWLALASGRAIVDGADLARPLPFSWTAEVPGAINPQWGAQLLLGGHGSLPIALALNATLLAVGLGLTVLRAASRAPILSVLVALLATLAALAPHLLARPQSFSIALFPLALLLLERFPRRAWLPIAYGVLMVVWANLHGAFVIGQLAAGVWLVAAVLRRQSLAIPMATAAVAALAPLLNPAGPALLAYAYGQPATAVVTAISVEWQPSWPWVPVATPFWIILAALVAGRWIRRFGAPLPDLILAALLGALAISAIRHIPWFLLAAMPMLAADVGRALARAGRLRRALGTVPSALSGQRARMTLTLVGVLILVFQLARPMLADAVGRLVPDEPSRVVDRLATEVSSGDRILNEQVWGGYLAHRLWPELQTAMDGRLEIRSRDEWATYFGLMQGRDEPAAQLEARGIGWVLVGEGRDALRNALTAAGWEMVADDGYATLFRAPTGG